MTKKELYSLGWKWESHLSMEHKHCSCYSGEYRGRKIELCIHVPFRDGEPKGRTYRHYRFNGKIYKSDEKLLKAINCDALVSDFKASYGSFVIKDESIVRENKMEQIK